MSIFPPDRPPAPAGSELVSISGTAIARIPLPGRPECSGLLVDDDHEAVVRVEDGALVLDMDDLDVVLAWRNAFQQAASHLIVHRERQLERAARDHAAALNVPETEVPQS